MILPNSRVLWVTRRAPFTSRRARVRAFWHYIVRRYRYEVCKNCGRPVGPHTHSWWLAPDELWLAVMDVPSGVVCPPCFTDAALARGIHVRWEVVQEHR